MSIVSQLLGDTPALQLLERALVESDFTGAVRNCHVVGLDSVVLYDWREQGHGMLRYFYAREGNPLSKLCNSEGHFTLGVHNHRYELWLKPFLGVMQNIEFTLGGDESFLYRYRFESGLSGKMGAVLEEWVSARCETVRHLFPGQVRYMNPEDLHTVGVPKEAAWIVVEGHTRPELADSSRIYSPRPDLTLSSEGLYQPMSPDEARELTLDLYRRAKEGQ